MVLIFDGGEGGAHNTWDYVHVIDPDDEDQAGLVGAGSERPRRAAGADGVPGGGAGSGMPGWLLLGSVGAACLLIGAAASAMACRRRA